MQFWNNSMSFFGPRNMFPQGTESRLVSIWSRKEDCSLFLCVHVCVCVCVFFRPPKPIFCCWSKRLRMCWCFLRRKTCILEPKTDSCARVHNRVMKPFIFCSFSQGLETNLVNSLSEVPVHRNISIMALNTGNCCCTPRGRHSKESALEWTVVTNGLHQLTQFRRLLQAS